MPDPTKEVKNETKMKQNQISHQRTKVAAAIVVSLHTKNQGQRWPQRSPPRSADEGNQTAMRERFLRHLAWEGAAFRGRESYNGREKVVA